MPYNFWSLQLEGAEKGREQLRAIGNETIKKYLLGSLEETRKTQLEERLLNDAQLFEEVLIAEDELVDHYVAGRLSVDDKVRFESHFLVTPDRIRKIQFGHTFQKYLELNDSAAAPLAAKPVNRFQLWPLRPVIAFTLVIIACLASLGLYWGLIHKDGASSGKPHVITLAATGTTRSTGQGLHREAIPPDTSTIELRLVVLEIRYRTYKADFESETTKVTDVTSSRTREENGQKSVVFSVPSKQLPPDDYQVKLSGTDEAGEKEFIDSYSFGIARR
jgi:hypothetical protein